MSGAVPELRFPEFTGPIKPVKLSEVATFSKGKGVSKSDIDPNGPLPCIRYGELYTVYGTVIDDPVSRTSVPAKDLILSKGGEVIVPASGETAKDIATAAVVKRPGVAMGGDLNIIRSDHDGAYLASYLSGRKRMALAAMAQGNSVVHLYAAQLGSLDVHLPELQEERKVSKFLSNIDAKLAALREKADGLRQFKTGLMQRLFSQEKRFTREDGSDYPDWEERKLGDLVGWVRTNSLSREHLTDDDASGVQNIHYGDIHSKFRAIFRQSNEEVPFITTSAPLRTISDEDFVRPGDVVIADASEDYADIGKAIEIMEVRERSMIAGLHTFIARPKQGVLAPGFAGYLLRSAPLRRQIVRAAQGVSVLGISKGNLEKITLGLPAHEEQEKIAGALMAVDAKIDAVTDQITHMETFKKGLLQKMFV
jgi:type I restriction enzyme S subunit